MKVDVGGIGGYNTALYSGTSSFHRRESISGRKYCKDYRGNRDIKAKKNVEKTIHDLEEASKVMANCSYDKDTRVAKSPGLWEHTQNLVELIENVDDPKNYRVFIRLHRRYHQAIRHVSYIICNYPNDFSKRYEQEIMEFGSSPIMFTMLGTFAMLNIFCLVGAKMKIVFQDFRALKNLISQVILYEMMVLINLPVYEAMFFGKDKGWLPFSIMFKSTVLASLTCLYNAYDLEKL
ncbi:hypothetical protein Q3G72_017843 [Acer saccharum]|nr:hypothetical protein Q3G72_017843 [Acer saccharum]